jgi:hypothetical protein
MEIGLIHFQGLWEGRKTGLSFSELSINRHFHHPLPPLLVVHAHLFICTHMASLACCIRRAACSSATRQAAAFRGGGAEDGLASKA